MEGEHAVNLIALFFEVELDSILIASFMENGFIYMHIYIKFISNSNLITFFVCLFHLQSPDQNHRTKCYLD